MMYKRTARRLRLSHIFPGGPVLRLLHGYDSPSLHRELFGIDFPNPVGLAAGFDSDGEYYNELSDFGFGFVEIGSLTPDAQHSPSTRGKILKLGSDRAIATTLRNDNKGVRYAISRIKEKAPRCILAASIAPGLESHKDEEIIRDYQMVFSLLYDFADLFVVNVSSPNADGIIQVQDSADLADIIDPLLETRLCYGLYKPILIKISHDIPLEQLDDMLDYCMLSGVDGIVAGGSARPVAPLTSPKARRIGKDAHFRISGAPIYEGTLSLVQHISEHTKGRLPIIACGGIMTPCQAEEMLSKGASLVELHTAVALHGPGIVKKILKSLTNGRKQQEA